jgi:hypothetical protein
MGVNWSEAHSNSSTKLVAHSLKNLSNNEIIDNCVLHEEFGHAKSCSLYSCHYNYTTLVGWWTLSYLRWVWTPRQIIKTSFCAKCLLMPNWSNQLNNNIIIMAYLKPVAPSQMCAIYQYVCRCTKVLGQHPNAGVLVKWIGFKVTA